MILRRYSKEILTIIYLIVSLVAMSNASFMEQFLVLKGINLYGNIFRYLSLIGLVSIPYYLLFRREEARFLNVFLVLPATIISLAFTSSFLALTKQSIIGQVGYYLYISVTILYCFMMIKGDKFKFDKSIISLIAILLFGCIPFNLFQNFDFLIENKYLIFNFLNAWYFIFLGLFILSGILMVKLVNKIGKEKSQLLLFVLAMIVLSKIILRFSYAQLHPYFNLNTPLANLPLTMCTFGMCILPISIYTKNKFFLSFNILMSVFGAIIVFVNPSPKGISIFTYDNIFFMFNHIMLFALALALPFAFKYRPQKKQLIEVTVFLLAFFIILPFINIMVFMKDGLDPNFSYVTESPIPIPAHHWFSIKLLGKPISPLYIMILWFVHILMVMADYFFFKHVKIKGYCNI